MSQYGIYAVSTLDEGPPDVSPEEAQYDLGDEFFASVRIARKIARKLYPGQGYRIWRLYTRGYWKGSWELAEQIKRPKYS